MRPVRMTPVGTPVLTMIPSRTVKVFGAQLTLTQPVKSFPLKSGVNRTSSLPISAEEEETSWIARRAARPFQIGGLFIMVSAPRIASERVRRRVHSAGVGSGRRERMRSQEEHVE